ncbi:MAG: FAD-dependent oxidoreductase [Myxococcales bacterium]|nr:FAD-dependent oxidoreductase [Myxococcales bacterium]
MPSHLAIVIGTGFGGAVAACRLVQAGFAVTVLERGRRYDGRPGATGVIEGFPRDLADAWLWDVGRGLFELHPISEMQIMQAAGYGGGSLIYANVHLRAPAEVFEGGWPAGYSRAALDPYYDLVAYMLDLRPITSAPRMPQKTARMRDAVIQIGREKQLFHPPLAVDFTDGTEPHQNKFGVAQTGCIHCGECVIGCSHRAKNSLDMNYLAVAEQGGAVMRTECEVLGIEEAAAGYRVRYRDHAAGVDAEAAAEHVFVCAGALGSTKILLRSRKQGGLPRLSARLGEGYSGNADLPAFGFRTTLPFHPDDGPTITTGVLHDDRAKAGRQWFLIEEGGFAKALWPLARLCDSRLGIGEGSPLLLHRAGAQAMRDAAAEPAADSSAATGGNTPMAHTAVFLGMGLDLANGRIELSPGGDGGLHVCWDVPSNLPIYTTEERLCTDLARALGGEFATIPFWRYAHVPLSVHHLGGCRMADRPEAGVTDGDGQVFGHPNLFVLDGAILPSSTGVNPAHTIAAVAERNVDVLIRRVTGKPSWRPDGPLPQGDDPLSSITVPPAGTLPPATPALGLTFRESMRGTWSPAVAGAAQRIRHELTMTVREIARFDADPMHVGIASGRLEIAGLTDGWSDVRGGTWNLLVAGPGGARTIAYSLPFLARQRPYVLRGEKVLRPQSGFAIFRAMTCLDVVIHEGESGEGACVGSGRLTLGPFGVLSLLASLRVTGPHRFADRAVAFVEFLKFYLGTIGRLSLSPSPPRRLPGG